MERSEIEARARALVGVRFRPQGRDSCLGLDCIGVVASVFDLPAAAVRRDYGLRGGRREEVESELARYFDPVLIGEAASGDLLLVRPGAAQLHLLVRTAGGYVHADAGLRRVVEAPGTPPWPVLSAWRSAAGG